MARADVLRLHRPHALDVRVLREAHELLHALHRLVPADVRELDVDQLPRVQRSVVVPALRCVYWEFVFIDKCQSSQCKLQKTNINNK